MSYNGWSNYETWNVALWLDNEQGSYRDCQDQAREFIKDNFDPEDMDNLDAAKSDMAKWLESTVTEMTPDLGSSMFSDLLSSALGAVDWYEIADHYIDDNKDELDELKEDHKGTGG